MGGSRRLSVGFVITTERGASPPLCARVCAVVCCNFLVPNTLGLLNRPQSYVDGGHGNRILPPRRSC